MNYEFRLIHSAQEIVQLRKKSFEAAYGSKVNLQGLEWNRTDEGSTHLGLYANDRLICCLRLTVFGDVKSFWNSTRFPAPENDSPPFALLARAATDPEFAEQGLHNVLRLRALEICHHFGLHNVFGTMEEKSLRLNRLLEIGYEIVNRSESWDDSFFQNSGEVVLVQLKGKERIEEAIRALNQKHNLPKLNSFPERPSEINFHQD